MQRSRTGDVSLVAWTAQRGENLQRVLDRIPDAAWAIDGAGRTIAYNSAAERILHYDLSVTSLNRVGHSSLVYLPDLDIPVPLGHLPLQHAFRSQKVPEVILFLRPPNETEGFWLSAVTRPLPADDGSPEGVIIFFREIDAARMAQAALLRSGTLLRSVVENVHDIVAVIGHRGIVRYVSPIVTSTLGYPPRELAGRNIFELVSPDDRRPARLALRLLSRTPGDSGSVEIRIPHANGSLRHLEVSGRNLVDNPKVAGILITARDITDRRHSEDQILFHASLLDSVHNAVIATGIDGNVVYWNAFATTLYQWSRDEVIGKHLCDVIPQFSAACHCKHPAARQPDFAQLDGHVRLQRKDASTFSAFVSSATAKDKDGNSIGTVIVSADISEQVRNQERLCSSEEQLRQLAARINSIREAERTRIARDIHDELGQQLTALRMDLSQLKNTLKGAALPRNSLSRLSSAVAVVDTTIRTLQRISTELRPGILDDLGLAAAIEWQLDEFKTRTGIHVSYIEEIRDLGLQPDLSTEVFRIFQEVLTNVARHANAGTVAVTLAASGDRLLLEVRDDGKGITHDQIADPRSLGLLGMRERTLQLGGDLSIRGVPGGGTTITLTVPIH